MTSHLCDWKFREISLLSLLAECIVSYHPCTCKVSFVVKSKMNAT